MTWFCRCPEPVIDRRGKRWPCQAVGRVVRVDDLPSTSGPLLHAWVRCDAGHTPTVLWEDLDLLG